MTNNKLTKECKKVAQKRQSGKNMERKYKDISIKKRRQKYPETERSSEKSGLGGLTF